MPQTASPAERAQWVRAYAHSRDAAAVCRQFGISRATLRKWWRRHQAAGPAALEDASRAPHTSPNRKVFPAQAARIQALRAQGLSLSRIQSTLRNEDALHISIPTIRKTLAEPPPRSGAKRPSPPGLFAAMLPDDPIFRTLTADIAAARLPPGTRLTEEGLARSFRTGRRRVRDALRALAAIGLVGMEPKRGATVATPSAEAIAQAYAARRLIEAGIVRTLAATQDPAPIAALRQHLRRQSDAERRGDKVTLIRLLTEFHLVLAALAGNAFLQGFVETLATTTSLAVLLYDQSTAPSCAVDEHRELVRLIESGNGHAAAALMARHLGHNEGRQRADARSTPPETPQRPPTAQRPCSSPADRT